MYVKHSASLLALALAVPFGTVVVSRDSMKCQDCGKPRELREMQDDSRCLECAASILLGYTKLKPKYSYSNRRLPFRLRNQGFKLV